MDDIQKLGVLLPHWMEHNQEHADEFLAWADKASLAGLTAAAERIRYAAEAMLLANDALKSATEDLSKTPRQSNNSHPL